MGAACARRPDASTSLGASERAAVLAEVTSAVARLTEAMNAGDPGRVLASYSGGSEFSYLGCTEYLLGGEAFARVVAPYYGSDLAEEFRQEVVAARVLSPDAAVVSLRGGSTSAPHLFWTQAWVREDGRWVVAVEHESWPGCREPAAPHPMTGGDPEDGLPESGSR